jgi:hypothetical protein
MCVLTFVLGRDLDTGLCWVGEHSAGWGLLDVSLLGGGNGSIDPWMFVSLTNTKQHLRTNDTGMTGALAATAEVN